MRLIKAGKIANQATDESYFDCKPSSDFSLGFTLGANWAESTIKPMFILFGNWCIENYVSFNDHDGNLYWLKFSETRKTTEELFNLWLEEQTKK